jgi:hypothetical protein
VRGVDGFGVFAMIGERIDAYIVNAAKPSTGGGNLAGMICPEDRFKYAIHQFRVLINRLELRSPLRWVAGIEGIKETGLYYAPPAGRHDLRDDLLSIRYGTRGL